MKIFKPESNISYQDPKNVEEIINQVKECENHDQVVTLINSTFPGWIMGWPKKFSTDYPHFNHNWEYVCKKSKCKTLSVIIVDKIVFNDSKYSLIKFFCEVLTVFGHSVRRKEEFIGCKLCGNALPTQMVYDQLIERKISTPSVWSLKCSSC